MFFFILLFQGPYPPTIKVTTELLKDLRKLMRENGIQGYLIPSADEHQASEHLVICLFLSILYLDRLFYSNETPAFLTKHLQRSLFELEVISKFSAPKISWGIELGTLKFDALNQSNTDP